MNFHLFFSKKSYNFAQNKTKLFMSVLENSKAFAILDYN